MNPKDFFAELKRRNVYKVAVAYGVIAWLLIQAGSILFPTFEAPSWVMKIFVALIAAGFVVALIISWGFEMTPQGMKRTGEISPNDRLPYWSRRKFAAVMAVLALAATALLVFKIMRGTTSADVMAPVQDKSIAVLPMVNQSSDPNQEYFSDGLSEELINRLGRIRELRVIGRTSSFHFKGKEDDSRAVGQALGVANLLEGSVRKEGARVRISVALVNALDGSQRWSHSYDRELKDIFALQTEIAQSIADQLVVTLPRENNETAEPSNQSLDAYNAYLRGEFYFAQFTPESTRRSIEFHAEAVRLDPNYAKACGALAWSYCRLGFFTGAGGNDAFVRARKAAERALALNPDLALARSALAYVHMNLDWNLTAAEEVLRVTMERAPRDSTSKDVLAILRSYQNRGEEAVGLRREAIQLDPLNVILQGNLVADLTTLGHDDEADELARKALDLEPSAAQIHYLIARIYLMRGQGDAALQEAQLEPVSIYRLTGIALAQVARHDQVAADEALRVLIERHAADNPFRVAIVYASRNEGDKVFEWLERAYNAHDPRVINTAWEELLKPFRPDPRFAAFCQKVGLPVPQ
jgi:TolB-like protein/Flp pilus assembly protein TadD